MKNYFKILLIFTCLFLITACREKSEDGKYIYYKVKGEGYVCHKNTKEPAAFVKVEVSTSFSGSYCGDPVQEFYSTDAKGYYKVRFIKRKSKLQLLGCTYPYCATVITTNNSFSNNITTYKNFDKDFLDKQKKTFTIDTLWI